ncbi:putative Ubiquitin-conjugating enzyme E2 J2 [Operophtera brumata]|nr:putative Ubiquitin-conjugating enzyme E2 J2 [Operophtera brumata]
MITPNGRFETDTKLCLSMTDFHPESWNPAWTISTILTGLLSFMLENIPTEGSTDSSNVVKRRMATESLEFNIKDKIFCELFPEYVEEINEVLKVRHDFLPQAATTSSDNTSNTSSPLDTFTLNDEAGQASEDIETPTS